LNKDAFSTNLKILISNMHPFQALKLLRLSPTQTEPRIFSVLSLFCQTVRLVLVPTSSRLLSCTTTMLA
jgi:hypothetical protein